MLAVFEMAPFETRLERIERSIEVSSWVSEHYDLWERIDQAYKSNRSADLPGVGRVHVGGFSVGV